MFVQKIAILGWGSLIWESQPDFDQYVGPWNAGGPQLPLEFSRKSKTRSYALTLVIDAKLGTRAETLYALSKRSDPQDVICDLRCREGTTAKNIGFINVETGEERDRESEVAEVIKAWARKKGIPVVVWTDLESSFPNLTPSEFIEKAVAHLKSLAQNAIQEAVKYVINTPHQIDTRLRRVLMNDEWFKQQVALLSKGPKHG